MKAILNAMQAEVQPLGDKSVPALGSVVFVCAYSSVLQPSLGTYWLPDETDRGGDLQGAGEGMRGTLGPSSSTPHCQFYFMNVAAFRYRFLSLR